MSERHTLERQVTPPVAIVDPTGATEALSDHLERAFGRVVRVDDLATVFEVLEADPVSCVLVAVEHVPTPVWRRLLRRAPGPVLAITDDDEQQTRAIAAGATDVLDPDAPPAVVRQRVKTVLAGGREGRGLEQEGGSHTTSASKPSLEALLERGPVAGIGLEPATGLVTAATPGVEPLLGFTPAELDGTAIRSLIHPDDWDRFRDFLEGDETPFTATIRLEHRDGDVQRHSVSVIDGVANSDENPRADIVLIVGPAPTIDADRPTETGDSAPSSDGVELPLESILEGLEIGVVEFEPNTLDVKAVNEVCTRRFGWTLERGPTTLEASLDDRTLSRVESRLENGGITRTTPFAATVRGPNGPQTVRATVLPLEPGRAVLCCLADTRATSDTALVSTLSLAWGRLERGHRSSPSSVGDVLVNAMFDILPASAVGCYVRDGEQLIGTALRPEDVEPAVSLSTVSLEDVPALDPRRLTGPAMGRVDTEAFDALFASGLHRGDLYVCPVSDRILVFATGIGLRTLDPVDVEASIWLAATGGHRLEAVDASRHAEGLEATLERRTRETRRVESLVTACSDAALAIPTTDRSQAEAAWCEALADLAWIHGVWLGSMDAASGEVRPRATAGDAVDPSVVPLEDMEADEQGELGVSLTTHADTEAPVAGEVPGTSTLVLRLAVDGRQFGTLVLAVRTAAVSPVLERALEWAGETVSLAYALDDCQGFLAAGDRLALTFSVARADVTDADDAGDPLLTLACTLEADLEVVSTTERRVVVTVGETRFDTETVTAHAREASGFEEVVVTERADGRLQLELVGSFDANASSVLTLLTTHGGRLDSIDATGSRVTIALELPATAAVRPLLTHLERHLPSLELRSKRPIEATAGHTVGGGDIGTAALTDRQLETLRVAYRAGYFSWPREQTGAEVASILGVSQPTFARHLRIAERKLIEGLFDAVDGT